MTSLKVSVVIPVYNTGEYLLPALESLEQQDLPAGEFEVVAVNDGSTDGSGELLDRWAATHPNVQVLHQANSGWPGQPRNRGLDASRGEYVLFMDADDYLGPRTLRRLHEFATTHDSDIVVPKLVGVGGRWTHDHPWEQTVADADLARVFRTLSPQKLFRRAFLVEQGLRFPEGKVRLEDGIFLARAYLTARRVSAAGDDDYYFLRAREGGGNISGGAIDPDAYLDSVAIIGRTVRELCADRAKADEIVLDLYRRKALKAFAPDRYLGYRPALRAAWTSAVQRLAVELIPVSLEEQLDEPFRSRSALARAGDVEGQAEFARTQRPAVEPSPPPVWRRLLNALRVGPLSLRKGGTLQEDLTTVEGSADGLRVGGEVRLAGAAPAHLRLSLVLSLRSAPGVELVIPMSTDRVDGKGWQRWEALVPFDRLAQLPRGIFDASLQLRRGGLRRRLGLRSSELQMPEPLAVPGRTGTLTPYLTSRGNLSLRLTGAPVRAAAAAQPQA